MRISNFLLWQVAYSELVFTECLWPEFGTEELDAALAAVRARASAASARVPDAAELVASGARPVRMLKQRILTALVLLALLLPALIATPPWPFAVLTLVVMAPPAGNGRA